MPRLGFIHDKLDIKFLILYIAARAAAPLDLSQLIDLTFCDEGVNYFEFIEALDELVRTGHMDLDAEGRYTITEKGKRNGAICESSLAASVRYHADMGLARVNAALRRDAQVKAAVLLRAGGAYTLKLTLEDEYDTVLAIELIAADREQAEKMGARFKANAEEIFNRLVNSLTED